MNIRRYEGIASLRNKVNRRVINMKTLDINKLRTTKKFILTSTKEALKDVTPIEWSDEVLNGDKKIIVNHNKK